MYKDLQRTFNRQDAHLIAVIMACIVGWSAPVMAADTSATYELKPVREYPTRFGAEKEMRVMMRRGKRVEVRKIEKTIHLQRLELGVLPNVSEARAVANKLKRNGLDSLVRRMPSARGYVVSLGAFANQRFLATLRERVARMGFNNLRVVAVDVIQPRFQIVERVRVLRTRQIIPSNGGPQVINGTRVRPARSVPVTMPVATVVKGQGFTSRTAAEHYVERLQREGYTSKIKVKEVTREYSSVQLRVYKKWAHAQRELPVLLTLGLNPRIETDFRERGYAINLGLFTNPSVILHITRKMAQAGFRNIYVIPVTERQPHYIVMKLGPSSKGHVRPARRVPPRSRYKPRSIEAQPTVLVFGAPNQASEMNYGLSDKTIRETGLDVGLRDFRIEYGRLADNKAAGVDASNYLRTTAYLDWKPDNRWEWQLEGRVSAYQQTGKQDFRHTYLETGESFVRYRERHVRVTLGAQKVIWGRVDGIPPTDRLSRADLRRYFLDELPDRRLPVPALRMEWFSGAYKTDIFLVPKFFGAKLPDINSIWSPIDKANGELIGVKSTPVLAALIHNGRFSDDTKGAGGGGIRFSRTGRGVDFALTVQRARQSTPYYELNPQLRAALLAGVPLVTAMAATRGPTFTGRHPWSWVVGGDVGTVFEGATWRFELAWLSDIPVTTKDFRYKTLNGVNWTAGVEFFPGGGNARVNLQLVGHHLLNAKNVLDNRSTYLLNGEVEDVFLHGRWRTRLRFMSGLEQKDYYLNPELAYLGWEPNEFYLGYEYFGGAPGTFGGFHKNDKMWMLGWRTSF